MKNFFIALLMTIAFANVSFAQIPIMIPPTVEAPLTEEEKALEKVVLKTIKSTVAIVELGGIGMGRCSGVIIKNDPDEAIVLTAKHCINPSEELYVEDVLASDMGVSLTDDLAYIILPRQIVDKTAITIAELPAVKGDMVFTVGYPNGDPYLRLGTIMLLTQDWTLARMAVIGGCSGGGIFNTKGELVGILWGGFESEDTTIFEPLKDVKNFIFKKNL